MLERPNPDPETTPGWSPRRWLLAVVGVLSVALGAIGVFVPGLPTTIFLIVAGYCFTRSCPWLEQRLLRIPLFAPYMRLIDEGRPMSPRARTLAITATWISTVASLAWLRSSGRLSAALGITIVGLAGIGTFAVLRYRRGRPPGPVVSESSPP